MKCFRTTIWGPNFRCKRVQREVAQNIWSPYRQDRQMEVIVSLTDMEKCETVRVSSLCLQKRCAPEMGAQQPRLSASHPFHGIFALSRRWDACSHQCSPELRSCEQPSWFLQRSSLKRGKVSWTQRSVTITSHVDFSLLTSHSFQEEKTPCNSFWEEYSGLTVVLWRGWDWC